MRLPNIPAPAGWLAMLAALVAPQAGCSKRNPDICCDSAGECTRAGLDPKDGLAPCEDGVCVNFTCVASGCDDDGDCRDPAHPTCVSGQCYGPVDACRAGGGARIIFVSTRDDAPGLYSMYVNGSGAKRIAGTGIGVDPIGNLFRDQYATSVSADGARVAFAGETDSSGLNIFTVGADGSGLTQITSGTDRLSHVEWSPDGMKLVVSTQSGVAAKAFVMRADGSHQLPLVGYAQTNDDPSWSPDSTKVVFASTNENDEAGIWTTDDNGMTPAILDTVPASYRAYRPRWSASGSVIAYLSTEADVLGLVLKPIGTMPGHVVSGSGMVTDARWSHDGTHLLVTRQGASSGPREIWLMDADGSNQRQLTDAVTNSGNARWSPDDQSILFDTQRDGNAEIYRMNADGSNPVNLTNAPGQDDDPTADYWPEWASCPSS